MENPKEKIYSILEKIALEMGVSEVSFSVEKPKIAGHGDFSSNIAMVLFNSRGQSHVAQDARKSSEKSSKTTRSLSESRSQALENDQNDKKSAFSSFANGLSLSNFKTPLDLAEEIVEILNTKYKIPDTDFEKVEIAAPGFVNFYLSPKYLQSQVKNIIEAGDSYGSLNIGEGKKVSVEFVSANPTGPLHIGNARGGPLGDSLANVLTKAGFEVIREYYHNDVGGQVDRLGETIYFTIHPDQKPADYEMQYLGEYVKELAQAVKDELEDNQEDLSQAQFIERAGQVAVELMLTEILKDCEDMGIKFDRITKESEIRKDVPDMLSKLKNSLKEKDGALWFAPNDEFLKDRETVVRKSDGEYTYFISDIVHHGNELTRSEILIDVFGANHSGHVPRLQAAIKALGFDSNNYKAVLYQYVRLKRGLEIVKMSKRAGNFVTAREVLDEVGKDAFRFFLLTPRSQTHMDFDLELAKKKASENPVFYVQYAYSRICSIFAKIDNLQFKIDNLTDLSLLKTHEEIELIRHLLKLPYLIEDSVKTLEVNPLTTYALEIATLFHKFYETQKVISNDEKLTQARLSLLKATQITLKNTLDLLGVTAPEHM